MPRPPERAILLSAGGTGGHLFPAEALAAELLARGRKVVIATDRRGHAFRSLGPGVPVHCLRAGSPLAGGITGRIVNLFLLGVGVLQGGWLLLKYRPAVAVGFGGYPSVPGIALAPCLGVPLVLHEQNAVLGRANAPFAKIARRVALSLPGTRGLDAKAAGRAVVTGNPVRADIRAVRDMPYAAPEGEFRILVTGGSQAAKVFSDVVPAAVRLLPDTQKQKLRITQQARAEDIPALEAAYAEMKVAAEIAPFFPGMAARLAACHLFIGRAGASTVAENAVAGRPGVYVPYPGHADMQQKHNAAALADAGGGWIVMQPDFTPGALARKIGDFFENPAMLAAAAAAAKTCGQPEAARKLADIVENEIR